MRGWLLEISGSSKILRPLYDMGSNGYISIEVDPRLSMIERLRWAEAKRLFNAIGEPNGSLIHRIPWPREGLGYWGLIGHEAYWRLGGEYLVIGQHFGISSFLGPGQKKLPILPGLWTKEGGLFLKVLRAEWVGCYEG